MLKILENRTVDEALEYFNKGRTQWSHITDPSMSEVYGLALEWKFKNIKFNDWKNYPIQDIAISIITGEL